MKAFLSKTAPLAKDKIEVPARLLSKSGSYKPKTTGEL